MWRVELGRNLRVAVVIFAQPPGASRAGRGGIKGTMKEIPLTRGAIAIVDDADYEELSQVKWYCTNNGYAVRMEPNRQRSDRRLLYMHRVISLAREGEVVDHANGNPLDNRRENLRICTQAQNVCNRKIGKNNSTGVKGVRMHQGKFQVRITHGRKCVYRREFNTLEEAKMARSEVASTYHGQFARN